MEKMPPGRAPELGDWCYAMIMPNGKLLGMTGGGGNWAVGVCGASHLQLLERDHLFKLPENFVRR